jgi:hypothetical protein
MPLTKKGKKIMGAMKEKYGERAEEVFYASRNKGTIAGVDKTRRKKKKKLPTHGSGLLSPLGQRTLGGYQEKFGDEAGHTKFEKAIESGMLERKRMFKGANTREAGGKFRAQSG